MNDEYIKNLSHEEKVVFIKIFCSIIRADNKADKEEIAFLNKMGHSYGLSNSEISEIVKNSAKINYIEEARKITDRSKALELIKEMCILANADDDLAKEELNILIDVAHEMNIEDEKIRAINRWVLDCKIIIEAGLIVMEKVTND